MLQYEYGGAWSPTPLSVTRQIWQHARPPHRSPAPLYSQTALQPASRRFMAVAEAVVSLPPLQQRGSIPPEPTRSPPRARTPPAPSPLLAAAPRMRAAALSRGKNQMMGSPMNYCERQLYLKTDGLLANLAGRSNRNKKGGAVQSLVSHSGREQRRWCLLYH